MNPWMIVLMLGYFIMGILFLILGFFYHTVPQISTHDNLIPAVKNDLVNLYAYGKQIFVSHARTIKMIMAIMAIRGRKIFLANLHYTY